MNTHDPFSADASVGTSETSQKTVKTEPKTEVATPKTETPAATTGVPTGSSREIMDWVGRDKTKAHAALQQEMSSGQPRKGLVNDLQEMLKK